MGNQFDIQKQWYKKLLYVTDKTNKDSNIVPLYVGTSIFSPPAEVRVENMGNGAVLPVQDYAVPKGHPSLVEALIGFLGNKYQSLSIIPEHLLVTAGAGHAMLLTFQAVCDPGDEVIVLSPHWHFTTGIIETARAKPVSTSFFDRLTGNAVSDFETLVAPKLTSKTKLIYLNYPNNPTGVPLTRDYLEALVDFAKAHDIYILADYAYMDYDFSEQGFIDLNEGFDCADRLISCYTLSKSYGVAGYRVGYIYTSVDGIMDALMWSSIHTVFSASTPCQVACADMIKKFNGESPFRGLCKTAIDTFDEVLQDVPLHPKGGYYGFIPTQLNGKSCSFDEFIEVALKSGVAVAPGAAFGDDYANWARVSLVGVEAGKLRVGLERLKQIMY